MARRRPATCEAARESQPADQVSGSATSRIGGGTDPYTVYFVARFDAPFASFGTWNAGTVTAGSTTAPATAGGAYLAFDTSTSGVVQAKVAISYVSLANAKANLHQILRRPSLLC